MPSSNSPSSININSLLSLKKGSSISVCIPCQNEEATIGTLVKKIKQNDLYNFVDEVIVVDDRSTDQTARVAANEGAKVVLVDEMTPSLLSGQGKGNALWTSLLASKGDIVVWCDGDVVNFDFEWIFKLAAPLLMNPETALVKGFYERPMDPSSGKGGGRTTELLARPLLSLLYPELSFLHQPLAGEVAGRRAQLEKLSFVQGWGVDVALLIDIVRLYGQKSIFQVDLGIRYHKHRPLQELSLQATEIALTLLTMSKDISLEQIEPLLRWPNGSVTELNMASRPSIASMKALT